MSQNKGSLRFIKNTAIFFVGNILSKLISFLLLPLYTSIIPTEDMGVYDVSITLVTMLLSFFYFEIWSAVLRYLYDGKTEEDKNRVIKGGLAIFAVSTLLFVIACAIMCKILGYTYFYLIIGYGIMYGAVSYITFVARGLGKNVDFSVSGLINTFLQLSLNVLLLTRFHMDYSALYISYLVGSFVQVLYLCIRLGFIRRIKFAVFDYALTKNLLVYALPLCFNTVAYWFLNSSNRIVYNRIYGDSASGIYSIGNRFGNIIALATICFTYAWQDLAFSTSNDQSVNQKKFYTVACNKYQQFLTFAAVMIIPAIKILFPYFVKGDYTAADNIIPSFIVVAIISGYSSFVGNIFYAIKETKIISISTVIAAAVNLLICYPIIKVGGAVGTNIAIIIAFVINIGIRAVVLKKKDVFSIQIKDMLVSVVWLAITICVYTYGNTLMSVGIAVINFICGLLLFKNDLRGLFKK